MLGQAPGWADTFVVSCWTKCYLELTKFINIEGVLLTKTSLQHVPDAMDQQ